MAMTRRRILADLGERRAPFRDRHIDGLEQAVLPAIFAALVLDGVGDVDAVDAGAGDDGHLVVGALLLAGSLECS